MMGVKAYNVFKDSCFCLSDFRLLSVCLVEEKAGK